TSTPLPYNATSTPDTYTLSLHDALPICASASSVAAAVTSPAWRMSRTSFRITKMRSGRRSMNSGQCVSATTPITVVTSPPDDRRSEEHTSELQSRFDLVCRLLLEKKKTK